MIPSLPFIGKTPSLQGRRVLITGGARGIGAALARRLHSRGAQVALVGLEPVDLARVAAACGNAPWREADVGDPDSITPAIEALVAELGGLDVVVANAGIAKQLPIVGGDPAVLEQQLRVNVLGVYLTLRAAGPHISHEGGYAISISSLAAALHVPVLGAYSCSKAAVEVLSDTFRGEMMHTGAKVGTAYFAELQTDMIDRGFKTKAAGNIVDTTPTRVSPLDVGIDALERGIAARSRYVIAPKWVAPLLVGRMVAQPVVELVFQKNIRETLHFAREEDVPLSTEQPDHKILTPSQERA